MDWIFRCLLPVLLLAMPASQSPSTVPKPGLLVRIIAVDHAPDAATRPPSPLQASEQDQILTRDGARRLNAAIPFAAMASPAAAPFRFQGGPHDLARAVDCLASAQFYEAGDDAVGEQAVAQVVLNRVRHPAFPRTICGVVFQGQERSTGCQFTFTCDGALARTPSPAAWQRARALARAALAGAVFRPVGLATHYHTDWVLPYWSSSLDKIARVGTHLFFRWQGASGMPLAFRAGQGGAEPLIGRIARLSLAHGGDAGPGMAAGMVPVKAGMAGPAPAIAMPPANKSWSPAPATPLPATARPDIVQPASDMTQSNQVAGR